MEKEDIWDKLEESSSMIQRSITKYGEKFNKAFANFELVDWYKKNSKYVYLELKCINCGDVKKIKCSSFINSKQQCKPCQDEKKYKNYDGEFIKVHGEGRYSYLGYKTIFASNRKQLQVKIKCNRCGKTWWMLVGNHRKGVGCSPCAIEDSKYKFSDVKILYERHNLPYDIINIYKATKGMRANLYCSKHDETFSRCLPSVIKKGCICSKCFAETAIGRTIKRKAPTRKKSFEEVRQELYSINSNIEILTLEKDYINYRTNINCKCKICGHLFSNTPDNIKRGNGCRICNNLKATSYNLKTANRYKDKWLKEPLNVYIIKCYNNNELFYKIGVTNNKINYRFSKSTLPYSYDILKIISTNKYSGVLLESYLHKLQEEYSYIPNKKFGGYTECFSKILPIEEIEKISMEYLEKLK